MALDTNTNNDNNNNNNNNNPPPQPAPIGMEAFSTPQGRRNEVLKMWRPINYGVLAYMIFISLNIFIILLVDRGKDCDQPLEYYALVLLLLHVLKISVTSFLCFKLPYATASDNEIQQAFSSLYPVYAVNRFLDISTFIWFIFGMYWTFSAASGTCPTTAPSLYRFCFAIIVIQIVIYSLFVFLCCSVCCVASLAMIFAHAILHAAPGAPRGASKALIDTLDLKSFSDDIDIDADHRSCAICLSDYETGEQIRFLPCKHHFHQACADRWLETNKSCPFCKRCIDDAQIEV
eukprot:TRINITY_DN2846_c0_g2_i1.p1 TRINITY_DN2846_c0_g2~~TRINITY_DN2846_c0_g2_i1.p1  ORF type:complete len:332 (+),score=42.95 TRINITY_DN2846_c0_g2_i1:127-996(+)